MSCYSSDGVRFRLGPDCHAADLVRRNAGHTDCIFSCFGRDRDCVLCVSRETLLAKQKTVPNFFEHFLKFLATFPFSFSDDLGRFYSFPWNVDSVAYNSHSSVAHLENRQLTSVVLPLESPM